MEPTLLRPTPGHLLPFPSTTLARVLNFYEGAKRDMGTGLSDWRRTNKAVAHTHLHPFIPCIALTGKDGDQQMKVKGRSVSFHRPRRSSRSRSSSSSISDYSLGVVLC